MLRRRGGVDDGAAAAVHADDKKGQTVFTRHQPILLVIAMLTLASPVLYVLLGAAGPLGSGGGVARLPIQKLSDFRGGGAVGVRGLAGRGSSDASNRRDGANDGAAAEAAEECDHSPGAAKPWALVDDALPGEGIRLELVTTKPLGYSFASTFCDVMADTAPHMEAIASGEGIDVPESQWRRQRGRRDENDENSYVPAACATSKFYLVDQETEYSDKIIEYVTVHEGWVIELFTGILSASACKPLMNGWPYYCRGGLSDDFIAGRRLVFGDYGANAGSHNTGMRRLSLNASRDC